MSNETAGFERNARTVSALTFLSRFGGLARDATMSRVFGIGPVMDAFAFGFMVPNLFRRLFGEGALSASLLPAFVRELDHDPATALLMARLLISRAMLLLAALVVAVEIPIMLGLFDGDLEIGLRLLAIMLPYAPLICMVALFGSMLHAYGRFGPTAAAPLVLNLLLVISALVTIPLVTAGSLSVEGQITLVAVSVLVAGLIQVTWSLRALRRVATRSGVPDADRARVRCREVLLQALPMAIGLGALQLNTLIDGLIASWPSLIGPAIPVLDVTYPLPTGSMSAISWAQRLYEFPLGVFGVATATAIFPRLARFHDSPAEFADALRRGLRLTFFVGLPASLGLLLVRDPLTAVILQGASFTREDTLLTGFILLGYAPAVWAYSVNLVFVRAFYARGEAMTPVKVAIGAGVLNLALNLVLIWTPLGVAGLAWSTAVCAVVQTCLLHRLLDARVGGIVDGAMRRGVLRTLLVTLASGACAATVMWSLQPASHPDSWTYQLVSLFATVAAGGLGAFVAARLMRMPELDWFLGRSLKSRGD